MTEARNLVPIALSFHQESSQRDDGDTAPRQACERRLAEFLRRQHVFRSAKQSQLIAESAARLALDFLAAVRTVETAERQYLEGTNPQPWLQLHKTASVCDGSPTR